jgi:hypothetical protein
MSFRETRTVVGRERSAVERFNDRSLEYVIAILRSLCVLSGLGVIGCALGAILAASGPLAASAVLLLGVALVSGTTGFLYFPNEGWRHGPNE